MKINPYANGAASGAYEQGVKTAADYGEVTSQLAAKANQSDVTALAGYAQTPIVTYTHAANKEVTVTAVDTTANTFTSVAHGLSNDDTIYAILNIDAGLIYLIDKLPGGMTPAARYFVVNKTTDTFQISTSSGGAAVDLTANANADVTKWHFERPVLLTQITGIPSLSRLRIKLRGRMVAKNISFSMLVNGITSAQEWLKAAVSGSNNSYSYPSLTMNADVLMDYDISADYTGCLIVGIRGLQITSSSASTVACVHDVAGIASPKYRASAITTLEIGGGWLANGSTVEVYKT